MKQHIHIAYLLKSVRLQWCDFCDLWD